ncbi:AraC family transcriptional regulator, regulatory protein of adaptative response / methylated-DNA-[protein]-cysteine methyltransferase [Rhizobiales bacterium GAS191]|jgi:AraC family transcriptional regulator of adaptative response/methylated-DNA-[protein]-cysteine methyltransferase|nr:AraC family transcriptional regulator, regulatory protein of adaptative response / methylated-DNA-[protein]-cysteine methyltransferase [Rhizobiales bacterium GAS113]SEE22388.1 AraC family transcriptional regulator, regulatory protein of adaptative response / methylated-DNA-[protein]-cysteine methyltransferase [Rhizobiales bacterium GAS188]SEE34691.1 AraC family transcriptional regulator, regulatory protein of adaptative response / methylated-DNA-[protein]-cysteine methyltransferase [Rhizobiale
MSDPIRYAWGQSSLGDFVAAVSARGLVAFEFGDDRAALIDRLRLRFADTSLHQDDEALSETIGKLASVIDHPDRDHGLTLDARGTDYEKRVWNALREIPAGQTVSYGDIAAKLGAPREAREVAEACAANSIAILIPCHRVVKKDGSLSGYRWGFKRKRALLTREHKASAFQLG